MLHQKSVEIFLDRKKLDPKEDKDIRDRLVAAVVEEDLDGSFGTSRLKLILGRSELTSEYLELYENDSEIRYAGQALSTT